MQQQTKSLQLSSIFRFAYLFFSGTLLSRFSGLARDICLAYFFGTSSEISAFFVAYRFSHLARRLFGEGSMQAAFVPFYEELKQKNPLSAACFFYRTKKILASFLLIFIVLSMGIIYFLLPYLPPSFHLVSLYSLYLLPSLFFICLFGLTASVLHSEKRFFLSSVSSVSFNLVWIISLFFLSFFSKKTALLGLSLSISLASLAQYLTSYLPIRSSLKITSYSTPKGYGSKVFKALLYGIVGASATQINNFLDPFFAKIASPEGPAYLWYAVRIAQLPVGLIAVSFSSALLPTLSSLIKKNKEEEAKQVFASTLANALFLCFIFFGAIIVLGSQGIQLLYGHGNFANASVYETSKCLLGYSLGLLPTTSVILLATYFYSHAKHRLTSIASLLSIITNLFFNSLFVFVFKWDAFSIAAATSLSAWINACLLLYLLNKNWGDFPFSLVWRKCAMGASIVFFAAVFVFAVRALEGIPLSKQLLYYPPRQLFEEIFRFIRDGALFFTPILCLLAVKKNYLSS